MSTKFIDQLSIKNNVVCKTVNEGEPLALCSLVYFCHTDSFNSLPRQQEWFTFFVLLHGVRKPGTWV